MPTTDLPVFLGVPGFVLTGREPCLTGDPERFFPDTPWGQERATLHCAGCPTRDTCLAWALDSGERGIWGGTTEDQRRKMRQRGDRVERHYLDRATAHRAVGQR